MAQRMWYDVPEIAEIMRKHQLWLKNHRKFRGYRADFRGVNLADVEFGPLLDLRYADFSGTDCSKTTFYNVNLEYANFSGANIIGTRFYACIFSCKGIRNPMPFHVNGLRCEVEYGLVALNRYCVYRTASAPMHINGEFVGYKILSEDADKNYFDLSLDLGNRARIAKLRIPADAKRVIFKDSKCRCDRAIVIDIKDRYGNAVDVGYSPVSLQTLSYQPGEEVIADGFDENPTVECGHGIHFFLTEAEAWKYIGLSLPSAVTPPDNEKE